MRGEIEFDDEYELQQLTNNNLEIIGLRYRYFEILNCKSE